MNNLTSADLAAIAQRAKQAAALAEAATSGPWVAYRTNFAGAFVLNYVGVGTALESVCKLSGSQEMDVAEVPDAAFIAAARTTVPALAADVAALLAALKGAVAQNARLAAEVAELERKINAYRAGVGQQGAGFPWDGDE